MGANDIIKAIEDVKPRSRRNPGRGVSLGLWETRGDCPPGVVIGRGQLQLDTRQATNSRAVSRDQDEKKVEYKWVSILVIEQHVLLVEKKQNAKRKT